MCASVLLKFNIKLFFGLKHITQIKLYATRRQMHVCKVVNTFFYFIIKSQYNFKDSNDCVTFPDSFFFHGQVKYTIFKDKQ